jgi:hypothetical protein
MTETPTASPVPSLTDRTKREGRLVFEDLGALEVRFAVSRHGQRGPSGPKSALMHRGNYRSIRSPDRRTALQYVA